MKFEQIEQVLEVAATGTFSQAARNLYMSQPNLSQSIKQLEAELDCQIFVRTSEGVVLTEDGKVLLEHMSMIQNKYQAMQEYISGKIPKRLVLRVATTNLNRAVPQFIGIARKYMGSPIHFSFLTYSAVPTIIDKVASCQADFGIIGMMSPYVKSTLHRLRNEQIEYHRMSVQPIRAVVGPENEFYNIDRPITLEELKNQTVVTFGSAVEDACSTIFDATQKRLEVRGRVVLNNCYLFYEMVQNSPAMGIISTNADHFSQQNNWKKLRLIKITDFPVEAETGWIKLRRMPLPDIALELIEDLTAIL